MGENGGGGGDWDLQELISNTEMVGGSQSQLPQPNIANSFEGVYI